MGKLRIVRRWSPQGTAFCFQQLNLETKKWEDVPVVWDVDVRDTPDIDSAEKAVDFIFVECEI